MAWDLHTSRISPYACAPLTDARVSRCIRRHPCPSAVLLRPWY